MEKDTASNYHSSRIRRHAAPILIWIIAVGVIAYMFSNRNQRFMVRGVAQGKLCQVTSTDTARVKSVHVVLFEEVFKDTVLARLDDSLIQAEIKTAQTQLGSYMAELVEMKDRMAVEATNRMIEWKANQRQFTNNVEDARLDKMTLEGTIKIDLVRLNALKVEIDITKQLLAENAIASYELDKVQNLYDTLRMEIKENKKVLQQTILDLENAQKRAAAYAATPLVDPSVKKSLERIEKLVDVQNEQINELLVAQAAMTLKSPINGVVIQVNCAVGETIRPVEPGFILSESRQVDKVVAYLGESQMNELQEDITVVDLIKTSHPSAIIRSSVVNVSPVVELMPERLWQNPNVPQWGREFIIKISPKDVPRMKLRHGEQIGIRL